MEFKIIPHTLDFIFRAGTSRGVMTHHQVWYLCLYENDNIYCGECAPLPGLSIDDIPGIENKLRETIEAFKDGTLDLQSLSQWPSVHMAWEMLLAKRSFRNEHQVFDSVLLKGMRIPINGLVWMGTADFMQEQIQQKISDGFRCIKMKIGAIEFEEEFSLLQEIRSRFSAEEMEIRVDANGAFKPKEAMSKLERLAHLDIHSIEQPIASGQWDTMAELCTHSPLPIALDEELIGISAKDEKQMLLDKIAPQYIILKPTLLGGFQAADEWIQEAESRNIQWWATSALESNIGLSAIAQWCATKANPLPQGLGTGGLYENNIPSPLVVADGHIEYTDSGRWDLSILQKDA